MRFFTSDILMNQLPLSTVSIPPSLKFAKKLVIRNSMLAPLPPTPGRTF
jgi:hypothetical protein